MAYLMSDVAAGSSAALQLQQNMAAAPDVQQQQAMAVQQQQENLQKTKLNNLVAETNFKTSEDSKAKIQQLIQSPEGKAALQKDDKAALLKLILPVQMALGDVANGAETMKAISDVEYKQIQTQLKQHEKSREIFGNALATIRGAEEAKVPEYIAQMPEPMKAAIKAEIPGFFEEKDPKLQKAQLEALVANGAGRNDMATNEARMKILEKQLEIKAESLKIQEQILENKRAKGGDDSSALQNRQYAQARRDAARIDGSYRKPLEEAQAAFKKAVDEDKKVTGIWGFRSSAMQDADKDPAKKAELKSTKAWNELQDLQKEIAQKKLDALEGMPEGKEKDKLFDVYTKQLSSIGGAPETEEEKPKATPAKSDVPTGAKTHDGYPARKNADGSYSTEVSITVTNPKLNGGKPTNIPSLWKGKEVDENTAVENALATGKKYESFSTIPEAVKAAKERSKAGGAGATSNKYTEQNPAKPTSKEEYDKLPPNSYYMQDGVLKRKKG